MLVTCHRGAVCSKTVGAKSIQSFVTFSTNMEAFPCTEFFHCKNYINSNSFTAGRFIERTCQRPNICHIGTEGLSHCSTCTTDGCNGANQFGFAMILISLPLATTILSSFWMRNGRKPSNVCFHSVTDLDRLIQIVFIISINWHSQFEKILSFKKNCMWIIDLHNTSPSGKLNNTKHYQHVFELLRSMNWNCFRKNSISHRRNSNLNPTFRFNTMWNCFWKWIIVYFIVRDRAATSTAAFTLICIILSKAFFIVWFSSTLNGDGDINSDGSKQTDELLKFSLSFLLYSTSE